MTPLRIALAGAGLIGRTHLASLSNSDECRPVGIADPSPEAAALASAAGVPHFATLDSMLDAIAPDGVIVATPNAMHVEHALACLLRHLPVLLEKPVAPTVAEALPLLTASDASGTPLLVGHHRDYSPIMETATRLISEGTLGRLVAITGSAAFYKPDTYFDAAPWRREPGGGPVLINLIHDVHAFRRFGGEIDAVQAMASSAIRGHAVEDSVTINLRFRSGALGNFLLSDTAACSRSWEQTSGENPRYARDDAADCYLVAGTEGSLSIPSLVQSRFADGVERSWWNAFERIEHSVLRLDPIARQLAHFCAVLRGECAPRVTLNDGLANLAVTEAVLAAAANGTTEQLP